MNRSSSALLAIAAICSSLMAQSNERGAGYDASLTDIYGATDWGRRGPAYPGGEVGISIANQLCNPGNVPVEWRSPGGNIGSTIQSDHPKFGFLVAREIDGRLVQISDWSYCKHAFFALASPSTCGGTCVPPAVAGTQLGVSCSDIYSASNNASRTYLGPPAQINPWLGTWPAVGNYFDIGHPGQAGYPLAADGVRSLSTTGFDAVQNRVTIKEADITNGATMFYQVHVVIEGERVENRANNTMSRPFSMTYVGGTGQSAWSTSTSGTATLGSILTRWPGATVTSGSNGNGTRFDADGRFFVAVKVTGPTNGKWRYEYVVQNLDNHRGGASFRLPVCPGAQVSNIGFRDIDADPLNNWTGVYAGGELAWTAPANNPQNWNMLFNFWFDCDVAPGSGTATIDQARVGPGALTVSVPTTVPNLQPAVNLAGGCGTPAFDLFPNGVPSAGNASFTMGVSGAANTFGVLYYSSPAAPTVLGPGCTTHLDLNAFGTIDLFLTNGSGVASVPLGIAAGQLPLDLHLQAITLVPSPPLFSLFGLSNGTKLRVAGLGCN
ncbi:MAG: hypothetical protein MUC36_17630 [Planctomycetes bacterium]|jgi:hypothetical protein|nr:hypothetical protein [Planctomycetota bacterium]